MVSASRWGILNPAAGIPIVETADATAPGQYSWQDLVMLPWSVPMSLQGNGAYLMNRHTWALCSTMSDANGRPIMTAAPTEAAPFLLAGSPVIIAQQMPDVKRRLDPDRLRKLEAGVHGGEPQGRNHAG